MLNKKKKNEIRLLTMKALEGQFSDEQILKLNNLLQGDPDAREFYLDLLNISTSLRNFDWNFFEYSHKDDSKFGIVPDDLLYALREQERTAETIEVGGPGEEDDNKSNTNEIETVKSEEKASKVFAYVSFLSAAALICLVLVLKFAVPVRPLVATIIETDSLKWSEKKLSVSNGSLLEAGKYSIEEGILDLQMLQGAEVSVTAPAQFKLVSEKEIFLNRGKLFAKVPERAIGFMVETKSGKFIDLGTDFGVYVDGKSKAQVAVISGSVKVNKTSRNKLVEQVITEGNACDLSNEVDRIVKIDIKSSSFASQYEEKCLKDYEIATADALKEYESAMQQTYPNAYFNFNQIDNDIVCNQIGEQRYEGYIQGDADIAGLDLNGEQVGEKGVINALYFPVRSISIINFGDEDLFDPGTGSFTVSFWFKPQNTDNIRSLCSKTSWSRIKSYELINRLGWRIQHNNNVVLIQTDTDNDYGLWLYKKIDVTDKWHHIVMVIDRQEKRLRAYLDGSPDGWLLMGKGTDKELFQGIFKSSVSYEKTCKDRYDDTGSIENKEVFTIGGRMGKRVYPSAVYNGYIYDMSVWKRALKVDEIKSLYNLGSLLLRSNVNEN